MASIQQRGKNSWLFMVDLGRDSNGKRDRRTKTYKVDDPALLRAPRRLEEHLNTELTKFKIEVESGAFIQPGKLRFGEFVEVWKKNFVLIDLERTTIDNYLFHLEKRILTKFKNQYMDSIKPMHILKFIESLREDASRLDGKGKVKSATIVYNYRVLRSIFTKALEWGVIKENPMRGIKKPKEDDVKKMEVYNEEELKVLFAALESKPVMFRVLVTLAITTGMRRGELAGLEWSAIDLNTKHVNVAQNMPKFKSGQPIIKSTKNTKPRKAALPEIALVEIRDLMRERYVELIDYLNVKEQPQPFEKISHNSELWSAGQHSFLFCHPDGKPFDPQTLSDQWIDFRRKNNLKEIRFHDLRHTAVSYMIYKNVHSQAIAKIVGHSNLKMMEIYGHVYESVEQVAASVFDDIKT